MPARLETVRYGERGVYLLTHPRSASNLFQTMMSKQPGYQNSGYKLFDAGFASLTQLSKGALSGWQEDERKALYDAFQSGFDSLQDELENASRNVSAITIILILVKVEEGMKSILSYELPWSVVAHSQMSRQMTCFASDLNTWPTVSDSLTVWQGKQVFIKEHAILLSGPDKFFSYVYGHDEVEPLVLKERNVPESAHTNPTSLPDSLFLSVRPIFQIRHPILMFPSMVRAEQKSFGLGAIRPRDPILAVTLTLRHSRALYDWYRNQDKAVYPQVIDADDIINDKAAVRHICNETHLRPEAVQYEWETKEETDPKRAVFLSTINSSKGIIPGLTACGLDFNSEKEKWKTEFGDEDGEDLAKFVLNAMPDYNYLLAQRTYVGQHENR